MSTRTRNSPRKTDVARPPKPRNATARDGQPEWNVALESVLAALPQPVCVVAPDNRTVYANPAAENFFGASLNLLKRQPLDEFVAFGCPLLALIEQVRRQRSTVNEYAVEVALAALGDRASCRCVLRSDAGPAGVCAGDAAWAHHGADDRAPAHPPRRRALRLRARRACWPTRSRTRCPASEARRTVARAGARRRATARLHSSSATRPIGSFAIWSSAWRCFPGTSRPPTPQPVNIARRCSIACKTLAENGFRQIGADHTSTTTRRLPRSVLAPWTNSSRPSSIS
jgi:PAS domain-containing protein